MEIGVPETDATILSDPNKPEYLSPPLIRNKLNPKSIAKTRAIFDFPKLLNINMVASIIILSIREIIMIKINSFSSFFVANWKLNGDFKFIDQFLDNLQVPSDNSKCIVICPTSTYLDYIRHKKNNFYVGAQNVSEHEKGAYTGEISCNALSDLNIDFCILGHSERRQLFNETSTDVSLKSSKVIEFKIVPIVCIGETLEEKENGKTNNILSQQLEDSIPVSSNSDNTIIAYEPVWAIGTGLTPTLEEINKTHQFIKNHNTKFENFKVLYGGSVNANNANEIVSLSNVDGALIGGASLNYDDFTKIIKD